jgi:PAS domain S-box-containing protein
VLELARFPMPDGGFVISASDITSLKAGEERIRHLLGQQRAIFDNAHVGIILADDRKMLDVNTRMAEIFGYDSPEMIGQLTEILYPSRQEYLSVGGRIYGELARCGYSEGDTRMVRKDGSPVDTPVGPPPGRSKPLPARSGCSPTSPPAGTAGPARTCPAGLQPQQRSPDGHR